MSGQRLRSDLHPHRDLLGGGDHDHRGLWRHLPHFWPREGNTPLLSKPELAQCRLVFCIYDGLQFRSIFVTTEWRTSWWAACAPWRACWFSPSPSPSLPETLKSFTRTTKPRRKLRRGKFFFCQTRRRMRRIESTSLIKLLTIIFELVNWRPCSRPEISGNSIKLHIAGPGMHSAQPV